MNFFCVIWACRCSPESRILCVASYFFHSTVVTTFLRAVLGGGSSCCEGNPCCRRCQNRCHIRCVSSKFISWRTQTHGHVLQTQNLLGFSMHVKVQNLYSRSVVKVLGLEGRAWRCVYNNYSSGCGFGLPTFNHKYFSFLICHFKLKKYPFPHNYCRSWKSGFDLNEHPYYWCNTWSDNF